MEIDDSSKDKKTSEKKSSNKFTEAKTGFSPPKKKIKGEAPLFEDSQGESLRNDNFLGKELQDQETQGLWEELDCVQTMEVIILNSALHKEMRTDRSSRPSNSLKNSQKRPLELDYTTLSPDKIKIFEELGGDRDDLQEKAYQLKIEFTSPIRNPKYPVDQVYSPAARHAGIPRLLIQQGREEGIFRPLLVDFNIAPFTPETPQQREEREKQQLIDYLEVAKLRGEISEEQIAEVLRQKGGGKSKEAIAAIKREIEIWQDHLNYIGMRKNQITGGTLELLDEDEFEDEDSFLSFVPEAGGDAEVETLRVQHNEEVRKIRKAEIEDAFEKFVAPKLVYVGNVEGYELYYPSGFVDLDWIDADGITIAETLSFGYCIRGPDGPVINFHHLTHFDFKTHKIKSIIIMVSKYLHTAYSRYLHFGRNTYKDLPRKKIKRNEWSRVIPLFNKAIGEHHASLSK